MKTFQPPLKYNFRKILYYPKNLNLPENRIPVKESKKI